MLYEGMREYRSLLPKRPSDVHKGRCGRIGVVAGSPSMIGAAILVSLAALRSGAGLVYLMTSPEAVGHINIHYPELIVLPSQTLEAVKGYHNEYRFSTLAIGPGLGRQTETRAHIRDLVLWAQSEKIPSVLDADALYALDQRFFEEIGTSQFVLTPHPKEFNRLMGQDGPINNREQAAKTAAEQLGQVLVLKGKGTVVTSPEHCHVNESGNPGMATAGSGDVLTGMIAALLGQGLSCFEAAKLGVFLHGFAGDLAMKTHSQYGMIASDIIASIGKAFLVLENDDG